MSAHGHELQHELNVERALSNIASQNLTDAEDACVFLENKIRNDGALEIIDSIHQTSQQNAANAVIYMRFMKMLCKFSTFGEAACQRCEECGAIGSIVRLCTTDDILVQINAIELLSQLAESHHGLDYIIRKDIIQWLIWTGCGAVTGNPSEGSAPDPLISTEALRVLGTVFAHAARQKCNLLVRIDGNSLQHFLRVTCRHLEEGTEEEKLTGLVVLADFALISASTLHLVVEGGHHSGVAPGQMLSAWMGLLINSRAEMVAAVLRSVSVLLSHPDELYLETDHENIGAFTVFAAANAMEDTAKLESVRAIKKKLFTSLGAPRRLPSLLYLMKLALQPVDETRFAAVDLLRALAAQPSGWGLQMLFQHGSATSANLEDNFYLYLKERMTEYCKEGKDWKFALILAVAHNPARTHLPEDVNAHIDVMVRQGAYFLPKMMDVATMEG